jgi:hypothetical protein
MNYKHCKRPLGTNKPLYDLSTKNENNTLVWWTFKYNSNFINYSYGLLWTLQHAKLNYQGLDMHFYRQNMLKYIMLGKTNGLITSLRYCCLENWSIKDFYTHMMDIMAKISYHYGLMCTNKDTKCIFYKIPTKLTASKESHR